MLTIEQGIKKTLFQIRSLIWSKENEPSWDYDHSLVIKGRNNTLCYFDIIQLTGAEYQLRLTFARNLKFLGFVNIDFFEFDSFEFKKVKEWCFEKTPFEISLLHKKQWWEIEE